MATTTFKIGDTIVHRIIEMECGFTPALEFLPKLTPETLAESRSWMKTPLALDDQERLVLCFQAYIIRTGKHTILVDSCVGNDKNRPTRPIWHMKTDSVFMDGLKEVGLSVNDIDFVLCTHLHVDHVGWNTRLENGRWVPTFQNAKYLFSKTELDFWLAENDRETVPPIADSVIPIAAALLPSPRAAGIMLLTSIRHAPAPCSEPCARRRPSRNARIRRFCSGSSSGPGAPSPWAFSWIPASSPANSSARSLRLSAAAKQSKPLPRLALLAGTSIVAMGVGMRPEYTEARRLGRSKRRVPEAADEVVVDQAGGLHEGVDDGRPHE